MQHTELLSSSPGHTNETLQEQHMHTTGKHIGTSCHNDNRDMR
jgi:hypothetical protein